MAGNGQDELVDLINGELRSDSGSLLGSVNMVTSFATASIGALLLFMGIATAYAPGSKYQVYWALILAP